nr:amidophosphoribosyltransferase [Spirochaetota bacterium]
IRKYLEVESVAYLTVESMLKSINRPDMKFCTACFDGNYPLAIEQSEDNQKYLFEEVAMSEYY